MSHHHDCCSDCGRSGCICKAAPTPPPLPKLTFSDPGDLYLLSAQPYHEAYWFGVRNNEDAVKWSRTAKPVEREANARWYAESLKMLDRRRLYVLSFRHRSYPEKYVGIGRLDHRGSWTELSIVLEPFARGRGLGTRAVTILAARAEELGWPIAGAVVNGKNRRSMKTFLKAGFTLRARRWVEFRRYKTRREKK